MLEGGGLENRDETGLKKEVVGCRKLEGIKVVCDENCLLSFSRARQCKF